VAQPKMAVNMALTSLLVCSDAQAVQVLTRILPDLGISVESCGDLRMARARIEDRHFDALVVDCQDESAAVELIAQARKSPSNQNIVAIAS
jgi:CheY-like chemotaxis protein